jgi:hypothetical protein
MDDNDVLVSIDGKLARETRICCVLGSRPPELLDRTGVVSRHKYIPTSLYDALGGDMSETALSNKRVQPRLIPGLDPR